MLIVGLLLLALVTVDVFVTVLHPHGNGGPLNRLQNRLVWALFRTAGLRRSRRWFALSGPLLSMLTPIVWMTLFVVAFAMIYQPHIDEFLASPGTLRSGWIEALYYSGFTASTLGIGDIVPNAEEMRIVTVLQGFGGFALVSASLSYIMAVTREYGTKSALATEIRMRLDALAPGAVPEGDEWDGWCGDVARKLLSVTHAHEQFPILRYFRPPDGGEALLMQLRRLAAVDGRLRNSNPAAGRSPGAALLGRAIDSHVESQAARLLRREPGQTTEDLDRLIEHLALH